MARPPTSRLRPWIGSAVLHLLFVAVLVIAAYRWRSDEPAPQLAIEGNVVRYEDLPASVKSGKPLRERPPPAVTPPTPAPVPEAAKPEPPTEPAPDLAAEAARREREAQESKLAAERERADEQRALEARQAKDAAAAAEEHERKVAAEAEAKRKAEADAKLAAEKQKQDESARDAKIEAERKAALQRDLEREEEGEAFARSGVVDEYRTLLTQAIERNWIRPPSAKAGLKCTLDVTQATGGTVVDVSIDECNGDQAVRESIVNAVYKSSPLPPPRDPRAFQRRLVIDFRPTE